MREISKETKYTNKNEWLRTCVTVIISLIIGIWGGKQITNIDMDEYLKEQTKEKIALEEEVEDLKKQNEELVTKIDALNKELSDSTAKAFPEGYYYPESVVYLLDEFEVNNGKSYKSFADTSVYMKGQIYNNGIALSQTGKASFYLNKKYKLLEFILGPIDNKETKNVMTLKIYIDGKQINEVINHDYEKECTTYSIDVSDGNELTLQWTNCSYGSFGIADLKVYE